MIVVICIDEKGGMMFNHRRQSQDQALREDVIKECAKGVLHMNAYSAAMFGKDAGITIRVSEDFMEEALEDEYCFVEDERLDKYQGQIKSVILYRWNRRYPADVYFTMSLTDGRWELERMEELKGTSHDCITKEVYKRVV